MLLCEDPHNIFIMFILQIGLAANIFGSAEEEHAGGTYQ